MWDEDQVITIVNNYLSDIKMRFKAQLIELGKSEDEIDEIMQRLGWAINHSKDDHSIEEMNKEL